METGMEQGCKEAKCTKELDTAISTQLTDYINTHVASCQDVLVVSSMLSQSAVSPPSCNKINYISVTGQHLTMLSY